MHGQQAQQPVAAAAGRGGYAPQGRGAGRVAPAAGRGGPRPAAPGPGPAGAAGRGRGAPAAAPPRPAVQAPVRPAVAPVGASDSEDEPNTAGMSRSQLKRLRKKKRDGKGA